MAGAIKKVLFTCITILCGVAIALVLTEWILGVLHTRRERALQEQVEPYYPWSLYTGRGEKISLQSGYLKLVMHPFVGYRTMPSQKTPYFSINSLGFRGKDFEQGEGQDQDQQGRGRIVVVGGSTAFGTGLRSDEETFAAHLERLLPDKQVINAAVIGYQSGQELVWVLTHLVDLRPEMVIVLDGFNDFGQVLSQEQDFNRLGINGFDELEEQLRMLYVVSASTCVGKLAAVPTLMFPHVWQAFKEIRSRTGEALYRTLVRWGVFRFLKRVGLWREGKGAAAREPIFRTKDTEPVLDEKITLISRRYAVNMIKMRNVLRGFDADFLCLLQPDGELVQTDSRTKGALSAEHYGLFREKAKSLLQQEGVAVVDLNEYGERLRSEMFMDRAHLNDQGNRIMAEIAVEAIKGRARR